jgi:hypothetical protein
VKRLSPFLAFAFALTLVFAPVAWAAAKASASSGPIDRSPGAPVAHALSTVTGIAISPLLGTSAYGAYQYFRTNEAARGALPWYAQPKFWAPALLIVLVCAAKDSFGPAVPPMLKKPLDILEVAENKFSGLIAAGAVVPFAMDAFSKLLLDEAGHLEATGSGGMAMIHSLAVNWAPALDLLTVPVGIAVFAIVWMASHAINVLILLSPWGGVDAALKAARTALLGLVTLTATMNPWLGALLSVVVIVVAYFVAGWSFRLTVFGTILCWDFFTGRRSRFQVSTAGNRMFAGSSLPSVPVRTYGTLQRRADGALEFVYRPWLLMKARTAPVAERPEAIAVGAGAFFSVVTRSNGGALFLLPPRYRGSEQALVDAYGFGGGVQPAGLRKAWGSLRELVGGRAATPALAAGA